MKAMKNRFQGFTLIELMIVMAIMLLLGSVAVIGWNNMRESALLRAETDTLLFYLEESKSRSVAGTGGEAHGVYIEEDVYTQFSGSTYSAGDGDNIVHAIDPKLELSIEGSGTDTIVFSRITGFVGNTATVTVALRDNASTTKMIVVGAGGDISIVE